MISTFPITTDGVISPTTRGAPDRPPYSFIPAARIPALDGLRGIAILLVVLYHTVFATFTTSSVVMKIHQLGGLTWSGVDLFFVLSGFLIGGILFDTKDSPRYFKTFYARRAYRILPLYAVIILGYVAWLAYTRISYGHWGDTSLPQVPLWAYPIFTQNIWTAFGWVELMVFGVTWSLAVEEQFYLTLPALVRKVSRQTLTWLLVMVVIGAPLLRIALHLFLRTGNVADYVLMPCRADTLSLGVLVAILVRTPSLWNPIANRVRLVYALAAVALLGPAWLTYTGSGYIDDTMVTVGYSLLGLFYTSCLILALTARGVLHKLFCNRVLRELGVVSYCIYLVHMPLVEGVRRSAALFFGDSTRPTHLLSLIFGIPLVFVVAKLSWKILEHPMLRRGHAYKY